MKICAQAHCWLLTLITSIRIIPTNYENWPQLNPEIEPRKKIEFLQIHSRNLRRIQLKRSEIR